MALTNKQKRFCEEYIIDLNATQAAIRAGYSLTTDPGKQYFVYFLCNPDTNSIFYIGKGKGKRPYNHERESPSPRNINVKKHAAIRNIHEAGKRVEVIYFMIDIDEKTAYLIERMLIKSIGQTNITNLSSGVTVQTDKDRAEFHLRRVKRLSTYCAEKRAPWQIELYLMIVAEFKKIAA